MLTTGVQRVSGSDVTGPGHHGDLVTRGEGCHLGNGVIIARRTGTTRTLFGTVLLHIASVKPDLTQIARLVEFQKSVINISMGVIYLRILSLNKYFFQMKYKAFYCLWIIHYVTTITIYL